MLKWLISTSFLLSIGSAVVFSDQTFVLNNQIAVNTDTVPVSVLLRDYSNTSPMIKIKGGFYKNEDICFLLNRYGFKDFTLIGNGIKIDLIRSYSSSDSVKNLIGENINTKDADRILESIHFPEHFLFRSISLETNNGAVNGNIQITAFESTVGEERTVSFSYEIPKETLREYHGPYLINIQGNRADLVYRSGGLTIISKVRIIRMTDRNNILVENMRSGKKFQVAADPKEM